MIQKNTNHNKKLYIPSIILILLSCNQSVSKYDTPYLEIYYLRQGMSTTLAYPCSMLTKQAMKENLNYKRIDDEKAVSSFVQLYENLQPSNDTTGIDARIKVIVHLNRKHDTICMGGHFNLYKNGIKMKDDVKLLNYTKSLVNFENTAPPIVNKRN